MAVNHYDVETFAVIDLETNTLPDYNFNKVSITEMCIHAISKTDLAASHPNKSPRIIHKLTMLFNPESLIHFEATKITGLDNYDLEFENKFDTNAANVILGFLKHLRHPVCLVAHNGNKFDFPVLKRSFEKINMQMPSNLLCIDSIIALREFDENILKAEITNKVLSVAVDLTELPIAISLETNKDSEKRSSCEFNEFFDEINDKHLNNLNQIQNETTPKRSPVPTTINNLNKRRKDNIFNDSTDNSGGNSKHLNSNIKSRRVLFSTPFQTSPATNKISTKLSPGKSPSYKFGYYRLENIYKRLYRRNPQVTHQAEADVIMLMKIMIYYKSDFIEYSKKNSVLMSSIKKLGNKL